MTQSIDLDDADRRLLDLLQQDCALSNQELAERAHLTPPTCLRRVRRLVEAGVIERRIALLNPELAQAGLTAIVEVTLADQAAERMSVFEARVAGEAAVQQCYRVSPGPDFVLVLLVADMPAYHALVHRLFTAANNVRNVRAFFSVHRSKFAPRVPLPG
ncbi:leucine-responsive regulatory protein [mine drainage metagenome]|uniref:Leucine-responsive regulatory protein n=1 Tax=mine drainage metagenome TaxID=410659 RepID=A0A1J5PD19_9ZZZZ